MPAEGPFEAGRPQLLFSGVYAFRGASGLANYDVSLDGDRLRRGGATVNIVLNWFDERAKSE